MNLNIRQARATESELLSSLALRSKAYWNYSSEFMIACRQELTYSSEDIKNNHFFVAEIDNFTIGFFALEILSDREVELSALFIEPAYINQGYGRQLMKEAEFIARNLGSKLMIIQSDPNAKHFYLKVGGKAIGERESASIPGRYLPLFKINL